MPLIMNSRKFYALVLKAPNIVDVLCQLKINIKFSKEKKKIVFPCLANVDLTCDRALSIVWFNIMLNSMHVNELNINMVIKNKYHVGMPMRYMKNS